MRNAFRARGAWRQALALAVLSGCTARALPFDGEAFESSSTGDGGVSITVALTATGGLDTTDRPSSITFDTQPPTTVGDATLFDETFFDDGFDTTSFPEPDCFDDSDCDGIPDGNDPFEFDPSLPERLGSEFVFANTADELVMFEPESSQFASFGGLFLGNAVIRMVDIAIDEFGVLYVFTPSQLLVCSAISSECFELGIIGGINAAGFVGGELWVADAMGNLAIVRDHAHDPFVELVGFLPPPFRSRGDLLETEGFIVLSSPASNGDGDALIVLDPQTFTVVFELNAPLAPSQLGIGGLAAWRSSVVAFSEAGETAILAPNGGVSVTEADFQFIGASSFPPSL